MSGAIYSIQPTGTGLQTLTAGPADHSPRWSPNGKTIAFERAGDLWLMQADGSDARQLTSGPGVDTSPGWSADGTRSSSSAPMTGAPWAARCSSSRSPGGCRHGSRAPTTGAPTRRRGRPTTGSSSTPTTAELGEAVRKVNLTTGVISDVVGPAASPDPGGSGTSRAPHPTSRRTASRSSSPWPIPPTSAASASRICRRRFPSDRAVRDCGVFAADDPAVSPNGKKLVFTAGNETPQLRVVLMSKNDQSADDLHPPPLPLQRRLAAQALTLGALPSR